jgi:hypothetical protein
VSEISHPAIFEIANPDRWLSGIGGVGISPRDGLDLMSWSVVCLPGVSVQKAFALISQISENRASETLVELVRSLPVSSSPLIAVPADIYVEGSISDALASDKWVRVRNELPSGMRAGTGRLENYRATLLKFIQLARVITIIDPYFATNLHDATPDSLNSSLWLLSQILKDSGGATIEIFTLQVRLRRQPAWLGKYEEAKSLTRKMGELSSWADFEAERIKLRVMDNRDIKLSGREMHDRSIAIHLDNGQVCFTLGKGLDSFANDPIRSSYLHIMSSSIFRSELTHFLHMECRLEIPQRQRSR